MVMMTCFFSFDADVARQYCHTDAASVIETGDHVIISLYLDRDPDNYWVEAEDRLGPMVQVVPDQSGQ